MSLPPPDRFVSVRDEGLSLTSQASILKEWPKCNLMIVDCHLGDTSDGFKKRHGQFRHEGDKRADKENLRHTKKCGYPLCRQSSR